VNGPERPTIYLKSDPRQYISTAVTVFHTVYPPLPVCCHCHVSSLPLTDSPFLSCPHVRLLRVGVPRTARAVLWKLTATWRLAPCRARVRT
jgi:hypothetical protein